MSAARPAPMPPLEVAAREQAMEQWVGRLLQLGVLVAAAVVVIGAVAVLARSAWTPVDFRVFQGEPAELTSVGAVLRGAAAFDGRALVQSGLLLLIATPVARVALTLVAFLRQRDRLYVAVTSLVLALLLYGLLGGR